ncbi:uncharacterized protein CLUP02_16884 [Colletotrichum lupini]|uniref:Uncharacterized protein n=1 Tax=Colletotrichum lupini TaxID=145971 RepID=A0A9Q8T986_9PEZI|nr:uncharacterized protein CLUP02_16884 [Colletotrichum lupini]UQC91350.1 hypothetical protein CLUP02_16884 [Colletotrichum lupini]
MFRQTKTPGPTLYNIPLVAFGDVYTTQPSKPGCSPPSTPNIFRPPCLAGRIVRVIIYMGGWNVGDGRFLVVFREETWKEIHYLPNMTPSYINSQPLTGRPANSRLAKSMPFAGPCYCGQGGMNVVTDPCVRVVASTNCTFGNTYTTILPTVNIVTAVVAEGGQRGQLFCSIARYLLGIVHKTVIGVSGNIPRIGILALRKTKTTRDESQNKHPDAIRNRFIAAEVIRVDRNNNKVNTGPADHRTEAVGPTKLPKPLDVQVPNRVEQAGAFPWPERFFNRRKLPREWENTPWLYATLRDMEQDLKWPEEEDILRSLRTEENWAPDQFRLDIFLDILRGRTLQQLEEGAYGVPETKVALLIDSNTLGSEPVLRPFLGGLSARQLLKEAAKARYELDDESSTVSASTVSCGFIEAERRLIYVVDLDSWSILSLLGSSPESLYREVTEYILNHLSAKSEIGVSFAKRSSEEPLRSSSDITFMRRFTEMSTDATSFDVIYSSHTSTIVTGYDQHRWTGVAFLESWYEDVLDDEPHPDMEPRSYFIRILQIRLNQINGEWESLYSHLNKAITAALRQHKELLDGVLRVSRSFRAQQEAENKLDEFEMILKEAADVLRDLKKKLGETLSSAAVFTETDVNYFLHQDGRVGDAIDCMMPLSQIRKTLNKMGRTHRDIGELQGTCESMLESGISGRNKSMLKKNMNAMNSMEIRMLSWTTMMSQPLLNVAAIFSCDGIITFPRTWYNFLYALFIMVAAMGFVVVFLLQLVESGVSLFERKAGGETSTKESSQRRGVTGPVNTNSRLPPRRSTWCTSGMGHFQRRHADIGLLDLSGRSVLGQPAIIEPSLPKPPIAILASHKGYTEPLA